jgi:hypothetical protein
MAQRGRGGNTFEIMVFLLFSFSFLSLSSFFFLLGVGKEVRREQQIVQIDIGVHKGDRQL